MPNNEDSIYNFNKLKDFLIQRGYVIGSKEPYTIVKPEEVTPELLRNGDIRFDSTGIFVKDKKGQEFQVFLYKRDYRLERYGKPRFHICRCSTIDEFIMSGGFNDHYMRTNAEPVIVADMDNGYEDTPVDHLPLCKNCLKLISQYGGIDSTSFVEILKAARGTDDQELELDLFGYTKDWEDISRNYKESKKYTCEICGLKIDDSYDRQYIHCHHKSGDKTDNRLENLQCLCLYCHAHVDANHTRRLTTGANKYVYEDFMIKYK